MSKLSLRNLPLEGKKVLVRVDFNVPFDKDGAISDDSRIQAALPTLKYILQRGGKPIVMSHLGRPKGKKNPEFSLAPCAERLQTLLNVPVRLAPDVVGPEIEQLAQRLPANEVLMLENLRFYPAEEDPKQDPNFAAQLAKLGELYVNDAFGAAHRAHASIVDLAKAFPEKAAAGFLLEKEISFLGEALLHPKKPLFALIGGAKISTKVGVLKALLNKVDALLIGGGMAYTFFRAKGWSIGKSIVEEDLIPVAQEILAEAERRKIPLLLPVDTVITNKLPDGEVRVVDSSQGIPDGFEGVDIGPKTIELFSKKLREAATILWNGPLGVFEVPAFAKGTYAIADLMAHLEAVTIVGGGDSVAALQESGLTDQISHVSTGGGASLEYIEQGNLPGIEALSIQKD